ncbi:hypothetical protein GCM10009583_09170 [Ornithinicoccus hortensis]
MLTLPLGGAVDPRDDVVPVHAPLLTVVVGVRLPTLAARTRQAPVCRTRGSAYRRGVTTGSVEVRLLPAGSPVLPMVRAQVARLDRELGLPRT